MTRQNFKTVYFSDHPSVETSRRNLKIAFGERDTPLFESINGFSSCELRTILGAESLHELREAAREHGVPVNTFCLQTLRKWRRSSQATSAQLSLPTLEDLGLHSTFRAGKEAPLQRWYPWLEGYSPGFVRQVLAQFAPTATRILDPFGGCGTTPITATMLGKTAYYAELNPLLQFLVETKVRALLLSTRERARVSSALSKLADQLETDIRSEDPDAELADFYTSCFGQSAFFAPKTFEEVLRARTWIDRLACRDPLLAQFATVAVASSLIPSSNLRRAGDLRFRKGRETEQVEAFLPLTATHLRAIAEDVAELTSAPSAPVLVAEDARMLLRLPSLECDAVITSPPYLNGTNYFRNTKVELWFLRSLRSSAELAAFRLSAVTAGINDVVRRKPMSADESVVDMVRTLETDAYDPRIPQMVGSYFYDMEQVLRAVSHHLRAGAVLALDIGDSIYAGQRVPTDSLLTHIAASLGYSHQQSVLLRNRVSRDSTPLKQVLLVFEYRGLKAVPHKREAKPSWLRAWSSFKRTLPHQQEPYSKRNWGHPLHSLCSYQGKMKPSLAHFLVRTFASKGGRLLDPFAGVGTIPFEAALQGVQSFGFEISPAAMHIAGAKVGLPDEHEADRVLLRLAEFLIDNEPTRDEMARAAEVRFNSAIQEYFHADTYKEVLLARRFFLAHPPRTASEQIVFASLLHILHGNRPYALSRRSHPITPFAPTGERERRQLVGRLRDKVRRSLESTSREGFVAGRIFNCDATGWWPHEVSDLDAIVTSPPFFDSTRFYLANWMRLWFAGWEREDFESKPRSFIDERQKQGFRVYEPIFRQARERLTSGGVFVLHLGHSRKCDMAARVSEIAAPWFTVKDLFSESVEHCESHGIRDKGTVTAHQFLVLR